MHESHLPTRAAGEAGESLVFLFDFLFDFDFCLLDVFYVLLFPSIYLLFALRFIYIRYWMGSALAF